MPRGTPQPAVADLAARLLARADAIVDEIADLIVKEVDFYRAGAIVSRADLHCHTRPNVEYILSQLSGSAGFDLGAPREAGHAHGLARGHRYTRPDLIAPFCGQFAMGSGLTAKHSLARSTKSR